MRRMMWIALATLKVRYGYGFPVPHSDLLEWCLNQGFNTANRNVTELLTLLQRFSTDARVLLKVFP
jgi:hypothetical protein